jgi:hypothetical protein
MSDQLEVQQVLDHCMLHIKGAGEAMADDMRDAAMKLGTAAMMLASANNMLHRRAAQQTQASGPDAV